MFNVKREETIIKANKTISLEGVTKMYFENIGNVPCKIGIHKLLASKERVISADGNVFTESSLNLKFDNNLPGEIYVEIHRFSSCINQ